MELLGWYNLEGKRMNLQEMISSNIWRDPRRTVKKEYIRVDGRRVLLSTCHIVMNHAFHTNDLPLIYETAVFKRKEVIILARYPFRNLAKAGHKLCAEELRRRNAKRTKMYKYPSIGRSYR